MYDDITVDGIFSLLRFFFFNMFEFRLMVFNATFNNISVISWQSVLLVEETGVSGEKHCVVASHGQTLSHNVVLSTPRNERGFELTTLVVISTDCTGSCKSNCHMITTTTAPSFLLCLYIRTHPYHLERGHN